MGPAAPSRSKREAVRDAELESQPSLAEILLNSLNEREDAPAIDVQAAKDRGEDLTELLLKQLELEEDAAAVGEDAPFSPSANPCGTPAEG